MALTFKGGVQIGIRKKAANKEIEDFTPSRVFLPFTEDCTLKVGDEVALGQPIGEDALGVLWHASIAGKVAEIKELGGKRYLAIEADGSGREEKPLQPADKPLSAFSAQEIIETVRLAGIFGMGGGKSTAEKLTSAVGRVERIIVNCAESEPYSSADHRTLVEKPEEVVNGAKILMRALSVARAYIAIEDDKLDAASAVDAVNGQSELVRVRIMKSKYPQGSEKMLISAIIGKELPAGRSPEELGCFVVNCRTCAAVYRAFAYGEVMTRVTLTVSGGAVKRSRNLCVPLGAPLSDAVHYAGGVRASSLIIGGAMNGRSAVELDEPILSGAAVLCLSARYRAPEQFACVRCGRCADACPMRLVPSFLYKACVKNDQKKADKLNISSCIECGACAFICPARLPILEKIREMKSIPVTESQIPAEASEALTEVSEIPAEVSEIPAEVSETPAEVSETPADVSEVPAAEEETEKEDTKNAEA
ncbi:MAG: RnfABCDGE type electron transport complex subunit C [Clostridia bacterium]|nr:RnfABCDGE type electron transport complex subunit C [Clostridia bacterium]